MLRTPFRNVFFFLEILTHATAFVLSKVPLAIMVDFQFHTTVSILDESLRDSERPEQPDRYDDTLRRVSRPQLFARSYIILECELQAFIHSHGRISSSLSRIIRKNNASKKLFIAVRARRIERLTGWVKANYQFQY